MTEDTATKFYTLDEVSERDGKDGKDVWIIYKDSVYDVTNYMEDHPAGKELLLEVAGKNATKEFGDAGHSAEAKKELKQYKIGEIVEEQRKKKTKEIKVVDANPDDATNNRRSCISIITCGLCRFS